MADLTLESLAARIEALEKKLAEQKPGKKDWLKTVGMFDDDPDFKREVIDVGQAIREAEREAARRGEPE